VFADCECWAAVVEMTAEDGIQTRLALKMGRKWETGTPGKETKWYKRDFLCCRTVQPPGRTQNPDSTAKAREALIGTAVPCR
jgi:hypothetical protein